MSSTHHLNDQIASHSLSVATAEMEDSIMVSVLSQEIVYSGIQATSTGAQTTACSTLVMDMNVPMISK